MSGIQSQSVRHRKTNVRVCYALFPLEYLTNANITADITIHIRAVGEWTNRLYDYFEHAQTIGLKEFLQKLPLMPSPKVEFQSEGDSLNSQMEANTLSPEHLEAFHNAFTSLSKRSMILPIPQGKEYIFIWQNLIFLLIMLLSRLWWKRLPTKTT